MGDVLPRVLREAGWRPTQRGPGLGDVWARAAGADLAPETRPATLRRGVLTVEVRSAALLADLQGFRTDELLGRLLDVDRSGRITGLRFRLGVF